MKPNLFFLNTDMTKDDWVSGDYTRSFSALAADLPRNVNLMTLDQVSGDKIVSLFKHVHSRIT